MTGARDFTSLLQCFILLSNVHVSCSCSSSLFAQEVILYRSPISILCYYCKACAQPPRRSTLYTSPLLRQYCGNTAIPIPMHFSTAHRHTQTTQQLVLQLQRLMFQLRNSRPMLISQPPHRGLCVLLLLLQELPLLPSQHQHPQQYVHSHCSDVKKVKPCI